MPERRTTALKRRKAWKRKNHEPVIASFPAGACGSVEEFLKWNLGHLGKVFAAGNKGALLDAVVLCLENRLQFPEWLGLGVIDAIGENLNATSAGRRWLRRFRQDMIYFERADCVEEGRKHELQRLEACATATEALKGLPAAGSEDAIQKSYRRFKRNSARDPYRNRYLRMVRLCETARSEQARREFMEYMKAVMDRVRASGD